MFNDGAIGIRPAQAEACDRAWRRLGQPGTWWTGAERVALLEAARAASECELCRRRKQALSPNMVEGAHAGNAMLPAAAIEAVHRLTTDPGRLTESWYRELLASGLSPHQYVELVGVVAMTTVVETFARAIGAAPPPLPPAQPGGPSRREPPGAAVSVAWAPTLPADRLTPELAELYGGIRSTLPSGAWPATTPTARRVGNVMLALSLVPDEQYAFSLFSSSALYRSPELALTDDQRELVASAASAYNDCFY